MLVCMFEINWSTNKNLLECLQHILYGRTAFPYSPLRFAGAGDNKDDRGIDWLVWFMVFNATFNNISAISWQSVLMRKETGVPGENHQPVTSHRQTSSHNVVSSTPCLSGVRTHNISLVVIYTDCTGSWKSNYHTITTIRAPWGRWEFSKKIGLRVCWKYNFNKNVGVYQKSKRSVSRNKEGVII